MGDWRVGVVGGLFFMEVGLILSLYMGDLDTPDISTYILYFISPLKILVY